MEKNRSLTVNTLRSRGSLRITNCERRRGSALALANESHSPAGAALRARATSSPHSQRTGLNAFEDEGLATADLLPLLDDPGQVLPAPSASMPVQRYSRISLLAYWRLAARMCAEKNSSSPDIVNPELARFGRAEICDATFATHALKDRVGGSEVLTDPLWESALIVKWPFSLSQRPVSTVTHCRRHTAQRAATRRKATVSIRHSNECKLASEAEPNAHSRLPARAKSSADYTHAAQYTYVRRTHDISVSPGELPSVERQDAGRVTAVVGILQERDGQVVVLCVFRSMSCSISSPPLEILMLAERTDLGRLRKRTCGQ